MTENKTILVVDDDAFIRDMLSGFLRKDGYTVHEAANGEEGLQKFLETGPRLVICDRVMPVMTGPEFLKRLREMYAEKVPFVFLTSLTDPRDKISVSELEATDYLDKPVKAETLRACLAKILK